MSTEEGRNEEVERVKILIEKCILKYMKMKEAIDVLYQEHNIEPCFTKIIWKNLEEQNKEFFRNYRLRLALIDQITRFNNLLDKQALLMNQLNRNEMVTRPPSNLAVAVQPVPSDFPLTGFNNYFVYPFDTLLAQNPNIEMIEQRMNNHGIPMNNESASVSSSSNMDSNQHQLERTFTDDLNAYLSQHLGYGSIDSKDITVENQVSGENNGITNMSSNLNFQNSGFIDMPQRSNIFSMQLENERS